MWQEIIRAIPVFMSSMFKFILGPVGGFVAGLNPLTTIIATTAGMMFSVFVLTFFGKWLKRKIASIWPIPRKKISKKNKRAITVWRKYGLLGISILTPLLLTPIGGTVFVIVFGAPKNKIMSYMLMSALFWSTTLTFVVYTFGRSIFPDFMGV